MGRRNPFLFASEETSAVTSEQMPPVESALPAEAADPARPAGPLLTLSGIGISGDVRTAVVTNGDTVRIVKVNDEIDGYTVVDIGESSITLAQGDTRYILRFAQ
jgi:hypothetical protein